MIAFLSPFWLAALPLGLVGLFVLFRRGNATQAKVLSSLFLMKGLQQQIQQRKNIFFPLRFFVELLLVALLSTLAASLVLPMLRSQHIFIIDTSPSMGTTLPSGETALESAKKRAIALIGEQPFGARFQVWITAPQHQALQNSFASADETVATIQTIHMGFGEDRLPTLVHTLAEQDRYSSIKVFSDYARGIKMERIEQVPIVPEGHELPNIAIAKAERSGRTLLVSIFASTNVSPKENFNLAIFALKNSKWQEMQRYNVKAQDNILSLPNIESGDPLKLVVSFQEDVVGVDNTYYLAGRSESSEVLLVSEREAPSLGLSAIRTLTFSRITPAAYERGNQQTASMPIVFDGYVPEKIPRNPALYLLPQGARFALTSSSPSPVASFEIGHVLLRYTNPTLLSRSVALPLRISTPITRSIITAQNGDPLLAVTENLQERSVISGFALLPFEAKRSPLESILFLNALAWLRLGSEHKAPSSGTHIENVLSLYDTGAVAALRVPSLYEEEGSYFSRNFFSEVESDVSQRAQLSAPAAESRTRQDLPEQSFPVLDKMLISFAVLLAAMDILLAYFSRRYGSTSR